MNGEPTPPFPLHRLNTAQTKAWLIFPQNRDFTASLLAKKYKKKGVGLLSATLRLFVMIEPTGRWRELLPPHKKFDMWQVANAPYHWEECACRNYHDPEVGGPWKLRGESAGHHPFCQFARTAVPVYKKCFDSAVRRVEQNLAPQTRPDEWIRTRQDFGPYGR